MTYREYTENELIFREKRTALLFISVLPTEWHFQIFLFFMLGHLAPQQYVSCCRYSQLPTESSVHSQTTQFGDLMKKY